MNYLGKISIYNLVIYFLIILCILGGFQFGLFPVLKQVVPVLLVTVLCDSIFKFFKLKYWRVSPSSIITGLIIGLVGQFGEDPLTLSAIGVLAILIKVFITIDGRHIFNPAAAGLLGGMFIFNSYPSWWAGGDNLWIFLIWIPIFLIKMKRWAPMVGFLLPTLLFSGGFGIIFSSSTLFFLSVMLIEPKTSPVTIKLGLIYGLVCSVVYILIARFSAFDPILIGLLVSNLTARLLSKYI